MKISRAQAKSLKLKTTLKDFVYAIMAMVWSREVLASHTISGKMSNAFKGKEAKPQLDPQTVKSICGMLDIILFF